MRRQRRDANGEAGGGGAGILAARTPDPLVALAIGREILSLNRRTRATTIVVTHDRDLAFGIAHRIAFLVEGKIAAAGTPEALRATELPLLKEFLAADFSPEPHPANHA